MTGVSTAVWVLGGVTAGIVMVIVLVVLWLWCSGRNEHWVAFDDVVFAAERLSHFWVQEGDKAECPEWSRDKYVSHFTEFREVVFQIFRCYVFSATTNKYFAWQMLNRALLIE